MNYSSVMFYSPLRKDRKALLMVGGSRARKDGINLKYYRLLLHLSP